MPKISYLVATYDTAQWLNRHIPNLIAQQDPDLEIIIINHESPSYDLEIAKKWETQDDRVVVLDEKDYGCYGPAWMQGWRVAKGDFVCNSNVDDFHHPRFNGVMHEQISLSMKDYKRGFKKHDTAFAYSGIQVFNEEGIIIDGGLKPDFDFDIFSRECWGGPQVVWRNDQEFRDKVDFDHLLKRASVLTSGFDYHLWLYFMSLGYHGYCVPEFLTGYTQREDSVENSNKLLNNWDSLVSIAEYFPQNFETHLCDVDEFTRRWPMVPNRSKWTEIKSKGLSWKDDYGWQALE